MGRFGGGSVAVFPSISTKTYIAHAPYAQDELGFNQQ